MYKIKVATNRAGLLNHIVNNDKNEEILNDKIVGTEIDVEVGANFGYVVGNALIITHGEGSDVFVPEAANSNWQFGSWEQSVDVPQGTITQDMTFTVKFTNIAPLAQRVYEFWSWLDINYCIDVFAASKEVLARLNLYGINNTIAQKFCLWNSFGSVAANRTILNQNNFRAIWADSSQALQNQILVLQDLKDHEGSSYDFSEDWKFIKENGTQTINGVPYNAFHIQWQKNAGYVIDNSANLITPGNNIVLYTANNTDAQRWVVMPSAWIRNDWQLPSIRIRNYTGSLALNTTHTFDVELGNGSQYQYRVRKRTLRHNTNIWEPWSNWENESGLWTDMGWGDCNNHTSSYLVPLSMEAANSTKGYDSVEYELQSRTFGTGDPNNLASVSATNSYSVITKQLVVPQMQATCTLSANGLTFIVGTNAYRTNERCKVEITNINIGGAKLADGFVAHEGVIMTSIQATVPLNKLQFYPTERQTITGSLKLTCFGDYQTGTYTSFSTTVSYSGGALTPNVSFSYNNTYNIKARIASGSWTTANVSMIYYHDGQTIIRQAEKMTGTSYSDYLLPAPLNSDFYVSVFIKGAGATNWGSKIYHISDTAIDTPFTWQRKNAIVLNGEKKQLALTKFKDFAPLEDSNSFGLSNIALEGKRYEDVYSTRVRSDTIRIGEAAITKEERYILESILAETYLILRDDTGEVYNVAVKSANFKKVNKDYDSVELDFVEVNRELDYSLPY